jgi:hypothetical protein
MWIVLPACLLLFLSDSFAVQAGSLSLSVKLEKMPQIETSSDVYKVDMALGGYTDNGLSFGSQTDKSQHFTTNSYTLNITVSNRDGPAGAYQLEWYFIAKKTKGNGNKGYEKELEVVGRGKKNITLGAGAVAEETAAHDFASMETYTVGTYAIADDPVTGKLPSWAPTSGIDEWDYEARNIERYVGYLVLITENGQVIAKESNSSIFLKDKWIEKCRNAPRKQWKAKYPDWEKLYNKWF